MPEIADGVVEIKACAREPGHRTKIAVWSNDNNVDPVGACVGARGARVRMVVNELRGEKIDIVPFSDDPADFVAKALSPAKVKEVRIDESTGIAEVIVPDYQLSLAIGKEGQNARLAARLTGWRVDIKSETQLAEEEAYGQRGVGRGRVGRRRRDRRAGVAAGRGRPAPCPPRTGRPRPPRPRAEGETEAETEEKPDGEAQGRRGRRSGRRRGGAEAARRSGGRDARSGGRGRAAPPATQRRARGSAIAEPVRTCVGCRRRAPQAELVRFVAGPDGSPREGRTLPGRGAWLCRDTVEACRALADRRGAFERAFRGAGKR